MNTELILKELESAYNRQYRALATPIPAFKPRRFGCREKLEALEELSDFQVDWDRYEEGKAWPECVIFIKEPVKPSAPPENDQQKDLTYKYLKLRGLVVIGAQDLPELRDFLSK